jgi:hypothetical protein
VFKLPLFLKLALSELKRISTPNHTEDSNNLLGKEGAGMIKKKTGHL